MPGARDFRALIEAIPAFILRGVLVGHYLPGLHDANLASGELFYRGFPHKYVRAVPGPLILPPPLAKYHVNKHDVVAVKNMFIG